MADPETIWNDYPQDLLDEADEARSDAEAILIAGVSDQVDPYNIPTRELFKRWRARKRLGRNSR